MDKLKVLSKNRFSTDNAPPVTPEEIVHRLIEKEWDDYTFVPRTIAELNSWMALPMCAHHTNANYE